MSWRIPQEFSALPMVMGILNVTPDSFSDGGRFAGLNSALHQVDLMISAGAQIIDVGGESTRPGAKVVEVAEELSRVLPIIEAIRSRFDVSISIDTSKAQVMAEAVAAGASLINDVNALQAQDAVSTVANLNVPVCVMHRQGSSETMQNNPRYDDVVTEVSDFLARRVEECVEAGIAASQIIVDPGFGFGKSVTHNLLLMNALQDVGRGQPLLVGVSRKSMIGAVLDKALDQRLYGGLALAALATWQHAAIIRTHDVSETVDVVNMIRAVRDIEYNQDIKSETFSE